MRGDQPTLGSVELMEDDENVEDMPRGAVVNGGGRGETSACDSLLGDALSDGVAEGLMLSWFAGGGSAAPTLRKPACTRKSQTRLVLLTSILTRSRASRRRSFPPRRAYSRTRVSLMTR